MPHVRFGFPYTTSDGTLHVQGTTAYVSSADAKSIVKDGRGKVVKLKPAEIVELARAEQAAKAPAKPKPAKPAPEAKAEPKAEPKRAPVKRDDADA